MKLCIDCKHHSGPDHCCLHAESIIDMVDGSKRYPFCSNQRNMPPSLYRYCGNDARFFEPKIVETKEQTT